MASFENPEVLGEKYDAMIFLEVSPCLESYKVFNMMKKWKALLNPNGIFCTVDFMLD